MTSGPDRTSVPSFGPSGHDVFICHASEDKETFAEPLAKALRKRRVNVWYDAYTIDWGDSLRQKIDSGVATCRYGIVVLSPAFFAKRWPQYELDGLAGREMASGEKVILPVWHGVERDDVARYSPSLAERSALKSSLGVTAIARRVDLMLAEPTADVTTAPSPSPRVLPPSVHDVRRNATPARRAICRPARTDHVERRVTLAEAAERLGVSEQRFRQIARRGRYNLSEALLESDVEDLLSLQRRNRSTRKPDGFWPDGSVILGEDFGDYGRR